MEKTTSQSRIMIVGGDAHFSYLMQRFVRTSAHQVLLANPDDDVLALAKCEKPVAIILEIEQPESAGWRALRALKADPEIGKIPVIACSWLNEEARGLAEGASIYLRMPILHTDFGAALATILTKEQHE